MRHLSALLLPLSLAGLASSEARVIAVSVDNVIHPITAEILAHGIEQAEREGADLFLVRLNTPGGMLEATRQAIEKAPEGVTQRCRMARSYGTVNAFPLDTRVARETP